MRDRQTNATLHIRLGSLTLVNYSNLRIPYIFNKKLFNKHVEHDIESMRVAIKFSYAHFCTLPATNEHTHFYTS